MQAFVACTTLLGRLAYMRKVLDSVEPHCQAILMQGLLCCFVLQPCVLNPYIRYPLHSIPQKKIIKTPRRSLVENHREKARMAKAQLLAPQWPAHSRTQPFLVVLLLAVAGCQQIKQLLLNLQLHALNCLNLLQLGRGDAGCAGGRCLCCCVGCAGSSSVGGRALLLGLLGGVALLTHPQQLLQPHVDGGKQHVLLLLVVQLLGGELLVPQLEHCLLFGAGSDEAGLLFLKAYHLSVTHVHVAAITHRESKVAAREAPAAAAGGAGAVPHVVLFDCGQREAVVPRLAAVATHDVVFCCCDRWGAVTAPKYAGNGQHGALWATAQSDHSICTASRAKDRLAKKVAKSKRGASFGIRQHRDTPRALLPHIITHR